MSQTNPKGARAGGYHVKTGCITCKIRHLKCDEERPACLRCRSTGRTCDGYSSNTKRRTPAKTLATSIPASKDQKQLVNARSSLVSWHLSPAVTGTSQERQCFEYFRYQIGRELSAALELQPTYEFILQACHSDDVVKSAAIAIGSMGQRLRINHLLTTDNQQANALQEFAQVQYGKALKHLRARMCNDPERSTELAVISCFLFTILEFLEGNDVDSLIHLRSGLDIIRRESKFRAAKDPLRKEITEVFSIMERQAIIWLGLRSFQSPIITCVDDPSRFPPSFDNFISLDDAASALNYQITRLHHFRRFVTGYDPTLRDVSLNPYAQRHEMTVQLEKWLVGLDILLKDLGEAFSGVEMIHRVTVMQMNYRTTSMLLSSCFDQGNEHELYGKYDADFRQILSLAKSVIGTMDDTAKKRIERIVVANNKRINPVPLFSFYVGVIQPLYILAISCRNLDLCREAVWLLSSNPWREGAWDSFSMARIAERKIQESKKQGYYDTGHGIVTSTFVDISTSSDYSDLTIRSVRSSENSEE